MTDIFIQSKSDLITSQKTGKKYFTVTNDKDEKFICWDTGLYNLCEAGAAIDLEVIPGKTPADTPKIQKHKEAKSEIPKPEMSKDDWSEKDKLQRESIESQNALTNLTNAIIAGIIEKTNPLFMAWQLIICSRLDVEVEAIKKVEKLTAPTTIGPTLQKEAPQKINEGIDIKETLKKSKWSEVSFRKWLHEQLEIDVSGTLAIVLNRLNDKQRETVLKEIQSRVELSL